jgi:hypothetical protein
MEPGTTPMAKAAQAQLAPTLSDEIQLGRSHAMRAVLVGAAGSAHGRSCIACAAAALAQREGVSRSYFTRLVRLSYLAPDITQAILDGRQPRDLTAEKLLEHSRLPLAWHDQRATLGFA